MLREARGTYCLLLNEDSELREGSVEALIEALESDPGAGAAGAQLLDAERRAAALRLAPAERLDRDRLGALFLHRPLVTQSGGGATRRVGWAQSAALMVRREAAAEVGYLDEEFFVYSDETDFCKRLGRCGPGHALRALGARRPPRAARQRPLRGRRREWSSSTAAATATCESTTARRRR